MKSFVDLEGSFAHLDAALAVLTHDRWLLGGLRDGRLRVLADSARLRGEARTPEACPPLFLDLAPLARRCLFERRPIAVTTVFEPFPGEEDWERDWPAILYVPVGEPRTRPDGLLIVGSRSATWYAQDDIDYAGAIGQTLTRAVRLVMGPMGRLNRSERAVAQLMAEGCSDAEVATALHTGDDNARALAASVRRKLNARTRGEVGRLVNGPADPPAVGRPRLL